MAKTRVGIINVTGYAGLELARLLSRHPEVELVSVTGRSAAGKALGAVFPHLSDIDLTIASKLAEVDLAFSAMPHKDSAGGIIPLLDNGIKVIDISADFRLKDASQYQEWYGFTHPSPQLLQQAVYGMPELHRSSIAATELVANPGCYPTGAILALAPAVNAGLIESSIVVDSKSGISGAGRTLTMTTHFAEANEDTTAYALDGHRHQPEIAQELSNLHPEHSVAITFVPHLLPMTRGILTTAYAPLVPGKLASGEKAKDELKQLYVDFYRNEPFVRVTDSPPHTKHTWGNNLCMVHPHIDLRTGSLILVSAIDNLVKGAAGNAVHNMNLMLGLPETTGLNAVAVFP